MDIKVERTPNPAAMKFTVGVPVGGPATFTSSEGADDRVASILDLDGVTSVFMTADFVTLSKTPDASWETIAADATVILEAQFA
jgi:hypothetical protein